MTCDEKKQRCLNYAASVPEWTLVDQISAIRALAACASALTDIVQELSGGMIYDRYEHSYARDNDRPDFSKKLDDAGYTVGGALFALEVLSAEGPFSYVKNPTSKAEASYVAQHSLLENRCRKHGMMEVAYLHGQNKHL